MTNSNYDWDSRSKLCIAQGCNTEEMSTELYGGPLFSPAHIKSAQGCTLFDAFDRKYVDYTCGRGTNLLGYGNSGIVKAISDAASRGVLTSAFACTEEVIASEKLKELFSFVDVFKFHSSLKEARELALGVSMSKNGKTEICYDIDKVNDKTACVLINPTISDSEKANIKLLEYVRIRCDEIGALLVFDETSSAFRHRKMSVTAAHGVIPDLIILGGPLGGGIPFFAVGGKSELMNSPSYKVTANFAANSVAMASCIEFVSQIRQKDALTLWEYGSRFMKRFNEIAAGVAQLKGMPTYANLLAPKRFYEMCSEAGIIFSPQWFFSFPLMDETEKTLSIVGDVCLKITTDGGKL